MILHGGSGSSTGGFTSITENTETPLGALGTWEGAGELNSSPDMMVTVLADTEGELEIRFSSNGENYDSSLSYAVKPGIHEFHVPLKGPRRVQVAYTNGEVAQTVFRLYTFYGVFRQASSPLNLPYSLDSDSILTRPTWTWLDISRGLAAGITTIQKFGRNDDVRSSFVPVCAGGIYRTPQSQSATPLRIKAGGNANDTSSGSGARSIILTGLDENFELVTSTLVTAGASASLNTPELFTRLFLMQVGESGTYANISAGSHAGDIVIENAAGTEDWGIIDASGFPRANSEIGAYTIPNGFTGYVKLRDISIDSGRDIDALFFSRSHADLDAPGYSPMRVRSEVTGVSGGSIESFGVTEVPFGPYVGPTDIGFLARIANAGSSTAIVSVEFEIILVKD